MNRINSDRRPTGSVPISPTPSTSTPNSDSKTNYEKNELKRELIKVSDTSYYRLDVQLDNRKKLNTTQEIIKIFNRSGMPTNKQINEGQICTLLKTYLNIIQSNQVEEGEQKTDENISDILDQLGTELKDKQNNLSDTDMAVIYNLESLMACLEKPPSIINGLNEYKSTTAVEVDSNGTFCQVKKSTDLNGISAWKDFFTQLQLKHAKKHTDYKFIEKKSSSTRPFLSRNKNKLKFNDTFDIDKYTTFLNTAKTNIPRSLTQYPSEKVTAKQLAPKPIEINQNRRSSMMKLMAAITVSTSVGLSGYFTMYRPQNSGRARPFAPFNTTNAQLTMRPPAVPYDLPSPVPPEHLFQYPNMALVPFPSPMDEYNPLNLANFFGAPTSWTSWVTIDVNKGVPPEYLPQNSDRALVPYISLEESNGVPIPLMISALILGIGETSTSWSNNILKTTQRIEANVVQPEITQDEFNAFVLFNISVQSANSTSQPPLMIEGTEGNISQSYFEDLEDVGNISDISKYATYILLAVGAVSVSYQLYNWLMNASNSIETNSISSHEANETSYFQECVTWLKTSILGEPTPYDRSGSPSDSTVTNEVKEPEMVLTPLTPKEKDLFRRPSQEIGPDNPSPTNGFELANRQIKSDEENNSEPINRRLAFNEPESPASTTTDSSHDNLLVEKQKKAPQLTTKETPTGFVDFDQWKKIFDSEYNKISQEERIHYIKRILHDKIPELLAYLDIKTITITSVNKNLQVEISNNTLTFNKEVISDNDYIALFNECISYLKQINQQPDHQLSTDTLGPSSAFIHDFFRSLLTELPQPLDGLLDKLINRKELLRISSDRPPFLHLENQLNYKSVPKSQLQKKTVPDEQEEELTSFVRREIKRLRGLEELEKLEKEFTAANSIKEIESVQKKVERLNAELTGKKIAEFNKSIEEIESVQEKVKRLKAELRGKKNAEFNKSTEVLKREMNHQKKNKSS